MSTGRSRLDLLMDALRSEGELSVGSLAELLSVGEATIRRDLRTLSESGQVIRTYGGAVLASRTTEASNDPNAGAKAAIAALAAERLKGTSSLVITGGSTTEAFAAHVANWSDVTVITNSLDIAQRLVDRDGVELALMGGAVRKGSHSLLGHLAEQAARELRADVLVMGIGAISVQRGLMNDHIQEVLMDRAICQMAKKIVVLADATKFQRVAPVQVIELTGVTEIVTDDRIDRETVEQLRARGITVSIASGDDEAEAPS